MVVAKSARSKTKRRANRSAFAIARPPKLMKASRKAGSKPKPSDAEFWTIVNELPDPLPVGRSELDAIERFFTGLVDAVFDQPRHSSP